tara:strand:+ start:42 stop:1346 length:1305 start_codon:yes stop_codon:yes gene_type:complete
MAKKISLSDLETLKGLKEARGSLDPSRFGPQGLASLGPASLKKRNEILDKAIAKFTYVVDNLDQEKASYVKSLFNDQLQLGYETTMSGLKQDAFAKTGIVPIDKETIYSAIVNMDLPKDLKLEMSAIADTADKEDLSFSLANNNLGITYDNESQEIKGEYQFDSKDGSLNIRPAIKKDADSVITKSVNINKAIDKGNLNLDVRDTDDDTSFKFEGIKDGNVLNLTKNIGTDNNLSGDLTSKVPLYMVEGEPEYYIDDRGFTQKKKTYLSPTISGDFYTGNDINQYGLGMNFPITKNLSADISTQKFDDDTSADKFGLYYDKPIGDRGIFSVGADIDTDRNKNIMAKFTLPFGEGKFEKTDESMFMPYSERKALEELKDENTMVFDGKEYQRNKIYRGSDFKELAETAAQTFSPKDFIGPVKKMAKGGLAYLMGM